MAFQPLKSRLASFDFIAPRRYIFFVLLRKVIIHSLNHFLQIAKYFTNTPPHIQPASFIMSMTSRDAFGWLPSVKKNISSTLHVAVGGTGRHLKGYDP